MQDLLGVCPDLTITVESDKISISKRFQNGIWGFREYNGCHTDKLRLVLTCGRLNHFMGNMFN